MTSHRSPLVYRVACGPPRTDDYLRWRFTAHPTARYAAVGADGDWPWSGPTCAVAAESWCSPS